MACGCQLDSKELPGVLPTLDMVEMGLLSADSEDHPAVMSLLSLESFLVSACSITHHLERALKALVSGAPISDACLVRLVVCLNAPSMT